MNTAWIFLTERPAVFLTLAGVLGLLAGAVVRLLAARLPGVLERYWQREAHALLGLPCTPPVRFERGLLASRCAVCHHRLYGWLDAVLPCARCDGCQALGGRCYPWVELTCAALTLVVAWHWGPSEQALAMMLLTWCLLALSLIDARHQILPDVLVLPMLWLGLIGNALGLFVPLREAVWGAAAGYGVLWTVFWLFKLVTGKDGMGYGDFKLLALIGAWGGWQVLPLTLVLSSILGALAGLLLLGRHGVAWGTAIPFGPYLASAGWIALLWGDEIGTCYLQLIGFR